MEIQELKDFKYYLINRYKATGDKEYKALKRQLDKIIKRKLQNSEK